MKRTNVRYETLPHSHQSFESGNHRTREIHFLHQNDVVRLELAPRHTIILSQRKSDAAKLCASLQATGF